MISDRKLKPFKLIGLQGYVARSTSSYYGTPNSSSPPSKASEASTVCKYVLLLRVCTASTPPTRILAMATMISRRGKVGYLQQMLRIRVGRKENSGVPLGVKRVRVLTGCDGLPRWDPPIASVMLERIVICHLFSI